MAKLPQWIRQLLGNEDLVEPHFVPGNWFVNRSLPLPEGLKGGELREYAELSVEELSPFNVKQLHWGYTCSRETGRLFVYAAFDQKLKIPMADTEFADYVFPDFAQTFGLTFDRPTLIFFLHGDRLSGALFPTSDPAPQSVVSIPLEDGEPDHDVLVEAKDRIICRIRQQLALSKESTSSDPVCDFQEVNIPDAVYVRNPDAGDRQNPSAIELIPRDGEAGPPRKVYLPSSGRLWQRDIRKSEAKELLMKKQKWTVRLWRCSVAAILLFLLLGLLEGGLVGLKKWHAKELEVASELEPMAVVVERKGDMLAKINQITTSQLLPFEMLDAINRVRPANIYFTRFIAESNNALQIEAISANSGEVEGFEESLRELGFLSGFEISNLRDANNRSTFRLRVEFKQGALEPQTFLTDL